VLASASEDKTVRIWDMANWQTVRTLVGHKKDVCGVAFSPDGSRLASASADGTVRVWDAATGQELRPLIGHTDAVLSVVFSPEGTRLASASADRTVRIWDAATGQQLHTLEGHTSVVTSVAYSPDGSLLASGGWYDEAVRIWDVKSGQERRKLLGHTDIILGVAFSPDGSRLASASFDQTVRIWDVTTGHEVLTNTCPTSRASSVAFSRDGARLAAGGLGSTPVIWDARPWTPEAAVEREALGLLEHLFTKPLCKEDVLELLRTSPTITPRARQIALTLLERYHEETNPERYDQASWAILRQPYLNPFQYRFALQQAETACRLAPQSDQYRTTLAVAQYRTGQYQQALDSLKRERDSGKPVVLALLAMAQHRLGLKDQARSTLEQLRQMMQKPEWATNAEMRGFVREAEALLEAAPTAKKG
jgi:tricorn protease-like protein